MANYSQPPFGLPFAPPPQQFYAQQAAAGPPDGQPPGLNLQQFAQNNQQHQYPFWPPPPASTPNPYPNMPFPPPFLSQGGVIPPPPMPPINFPFSPMPPLPFQSAAAPTPPPAPPVAPFQYAHPHAAWANDRITEVVDSDREEGELSDGGLASQPRATQGTGKLQLEPPRSVPTFHAQRGDESGSYANRSGTPISTMATQHRPAPRAYSPARHVHNHSNPVAEATSTVSHPRLPMEPTEDMASLPTQRAAAADFVKLLHVNSVGYPALASEGLDGRLLEDLYRSLNLSMQSAPLQVPDRPTVSPLNAMQNPSLAATQNNATTETVKPSTAITTNTAPAQTPKQAPSPIEPAPAKDRGSYVAALAAARARNAAIAAASKGASPTMLQAPPKINPSQVASPPALPVATSTLPVQLIATPPATIANMGRPVESDAEKARKTKLLRQKLEAFKAKQATKKQESASGAVTPSILPNTEPSLSIVTPTALSMQASQAPQTPTFSGIPGLFLGTSGSNGAVQTQTWQTPPPPSATNPRKRPVAADFDDITTPRSQAPMYSRPLGQFPHEHDEESMIIEVSDDDSGDEDMDLDDDDDDDESSGSFEQTQLPLLPDFPSRSVSAFPFASEVSTPDMQASTALAYKQLAQTENEIARLKREIELKSKVGGKIGTIKKLVPSPSQTDLSNQHEASSSSTDPNLQPLDVQAEARDNQVIRPQRRSEIEVELAYLESQMESANAREIELEQQVAAVKTARSQFLQTKASLLKQLENLQAVPETEPSSEVHMRQSKDQQIVQLLEEEPRVLGIPSDADQAMIDADKNIDPTETIVENPSSMEVAHVNEISGSNANTVNKMPPVPMPSAQLPGIETVISELTVPTEFVSHALPSEVPIPKNVPEIATDLEVPIAAAPPIEVDGKSDGPTAAVSPTADDEDFYSPEPEAAPVPEQPAATQVPLATAEYPSEEGEVEMSESSQSKEEEYEPSEPQNPIAPILAPDDNAMEIANSTASSSEPSTTDDEEEAYEPPDIAEETTNLATDPTATAPVPDAQVILIDELDAMDLSISSSEDSDSDDASSEPAPSAFISSSNAKNDSVGLTDDQAPELQSQPVPAMPTISTGQVSDADDEPTAFVPYESPLRMFKSYRYHRDFANEVHGSFQSMTYSHQIDPNKPLCRFEAVGGTCNDSQCDGQHFRGMGITGEKILVQLGTANPGKSLEERQRWNDGLRLVLKELRQKNIKDPNGIADEIAKYRRKFLNDDTRVVNL